ncbi:MAG: TetR/AcrR family transcriptional regulator [Oscillospiraceae bacterium]|nr:TetR/AcrR family transcriptional regulator [Oscillospiraceae bacterium]
MSTKPKITKDLLLEAGMRILRKDGENALNARNIAAALSCSTQPLLYHFGSVEAFKDALYQRADAFHTAYLMEPDAAATNPMLSIGLRYIRFGAEEGHLFRFLFQSDHLHGADLRDLMQSPQLAPILQILQREANLTSKQAAEVFAALELAVHGYASFLANNAMPYDPAYAAGMLSLIFYGTIGALKQQEGTHHEETLG